MSVSVIIPTRNAGNYLDNLLEKLQNQNTYINEIIVLDTESTDNTLDICSLYDRVKVIKIRQNEFDHGRTRNLGARSSKGEYIVFLTQDALPENEQFISCILKPLKSNTVAAVYGRQIPRSDATPVEEFARTFNYPGTDTIKSKDDIDRLGIKAFFFTNVCSAFKRKDFEEIGGFPDNIILNEDMIIASKLILCGKLIAYASNAAVIHSHNYKFTQQFARYFDIGASLRMNNYILKYAKVEAEGNKFFVSAMTHLAREKKPLWIIWLILECIFKFIGYKMGIHCDILPARVVKKLSMHKHYWDNEYDNIRYSTQESIIH